MDLDEGDMLRRQRFDFRLRINPFGGAEKGVKGGVDSLSPRLMHLSALGCLSDQSKQAWFPRVSTAAQPASFHSSLLPTSASSLATSLSSPTSRVSLRLKLYGMMP